MHTILRRIGHAGFLPFGLRNRIVRRFVNSRDKQSRPFTAPFNGFTYRGDLNDSIDWHVYFFKEYESGYIRFLEKLAQQFTDTVFWDIGANVGHHTLFMARSCAKIYAFEPNPVTYEKLQQKITDNKLSNVETFTFGLGNANETLSFYVPTVNNSGTASFEDRTGWGHQKITAQVCIGDEVAEELRLQKLDLVKIDVEGFEKDVFEGLQETMKKFRPMIFFELESNTMKKVGSEQGLFSLFPDNYRFVKITGVESRKTSVKPFTFAEDAANVLAFPAEKEKLIYV